ncbi:hypothetical protein B0H17DRAFT_1089529, partial [Mycena rosella]
MTLRQLHPASGNFLNIPGGLIVVLRRELGMPELDRSPTLLGNVPTWARSPPTSMGAL